MKQSIRTLVVFLLLTAPVCIKAQTLEESLRKTSLQMDSVKNLAGMMSVSAQFDMLADKWPNEWSSNYYAAYAKVILSFIVQDSRKKDMLLDEADKYLEKVKTLDSKSDETYVLAALITSARIAVDGQNRGMQYSGMVNQYLEKAKEINPDNPRVYYLQGSSLFYQPEMYGGGKEKAKPFLVKAAELYKKENKTSALKPHWGEKQNQDYLNQCDEK
jgi:hypothetical protein